jgi:aminoglycoside phosphotransferase (APT) family kinase protein
MDVTDKATDVRKGEVLDTAKVEEFLKDSLSGLDGEISITQFPSGFSNLTYLLSVGETELVVRRPPFGTKAKTAHDMSREYKILTALHPAYPYSPEPLIYCEDSSVIGCPFYVMKRIPGIILRKDFPEGLVLSPERMKRLCERFVDVLLELHSIDYRKIGLADFGKPEGYVERQVTGWSKRYRAARTPDAPDCEALMSWLSEKMPPDSNRPGIIHNDFKLDNVVLDSNDPTKIVGVLDWEMATIGDRLMDLGNTISYWIEKGDPPQTEAFRQMPTNVEGALTRQALLQRYAEKSGWSIENFDFYYCFGLFRLAVIAQQIYYRFFHGQTTDERFKMLIFVVQMLDQAAMRVIETSDL